MRRQRCRVFGIPMYREPVRGWLRVPRQLLSRLQPCVLPLECPPLTCPDGTQIAAFLDPETGECIREESCPERTCENYDAPCPGHEVLCFRAPCSLNPCAPGEQCLDNQCGGCNHICCPGGCPEDKKLCPDGTVLQRDPNNNCEFPDCRPWLTCDNYHDKCPLGLPPAQCETSPCDLARCGADEVCHNNLCGGCNHVCCPKPGCPRDVKTCPDGSMVLRDPENDCEFPPCRGPTCDTYNDPCPSGVPEVLCVVEPCSLVECAVGEVCHNNYCGGCNAVCCNSGGCPDDLRSCSDGSTVARDPENDCEFPPCPPEPCTEDAKVCPDGSTVVRDPESGCEFEPCPECCDAEKEPGQNGNPNCIEGHACCPVNGDWVCAQGDTLLFDCGGELVELRLSDAKRCPLSCAEDVQTCSDGTLVSRDPYNNCEFPPCPLAV